MRSPAVLSSVVSLISLSSQLLGSISCALSGFLSLPSCGGVGGGEELGAEDLVIQFAAFQELFVGTAGRDTALVEDQNEVSVPHRRNPLGDDEDRAVPLAHEPV